MVSQTYVAHAMDGGHFIKEAGSWWRRPKQALSISHDLGLGLDLAHYSGPLLAAFVVEIDHLGTFMQK